MSTTMTTTLGTSNLRGSSRQTRTNPTRTSKTIGSSLRQNSLISLPPASAQGTNEPHGFYPAITHFADAISALPRDYRRHTSLLKEVDAKAWAPEENLQAIITQCLAERPVPPPTTIPSAAGSVVTAGEEHMAISAANSVVGIPPDNVSQYSAQSVDPTAIQRRQAFAALRHNLMQIMVTMDEKNHVINNANEELSRHIRRLDNIYPHIADEISEEARLGSLKHWAYTETNPTKKATAVTNRREAAGSLAMLHDTEIAHRSESRREAMLAAKKQRLNHNVESDFDEPRVPARKSAANGKKRAAEVVAEPPTLAVVGPAGKRKKTEKTAGGGVGMERSLSAAMRGGLPMSREPSLQENQKKRKPPAPAASTAVRKRLNVSTQDSPKLASSPLASTFGKEAYKRSPALGNVRPVAARARQNSTQMVDSTRARPSSSASHRNTNGHTVSASTPELKNVATITGKSTAEVKNTMKETTNSKGDRLIEEGTAPDGTNGDAPIRGGLLLERSASKQGNTKAEPINSEEGLAKTVASPRLPAALIINESRGERAGRGRASKTSTPVIGTFAESESAESNTANGNGHGKLKRLARPRAKDLHGLHDSLSPKGLPLKRSHKKGAGLLAQQQHTQRLQDEVGTATSASPTEGPMEVEEEDEENGAEDEERYCYCNGVSYGEMVACDNKDCVREWFHLNCIGMTKVPKSAKWFCDDCKAILARRGKFGISG